MNIEEIMKPYFDKKEEISKRPEEFKNRQSEIINGYEEENKKYREENQKYESELTAINVRINNLRNNKDKEIEEFVRNAVSDRPEFYVGYGAMIRKDLEQEYLKREKELEKELELKSKQLSQKISDNYLKMSVNNKLIEEQQNYRFYNVDVRELVDVKHELRKSLISAKKELELKLQETELRFNAVMNKLSTFKYEYDENHNVINGNEYRTLFEESNSLIEEKYNIQRDLKKVDEYLELTELTEEEVKIVMMSMSEYEKEEYNRRNKTSQKEISIELCEELEKTNPEIASRLNEKLNALITDKPELVNRLESLSLFDPNFTNILSELIKEYPELSNIFLEVLQLNKENTKEEEKLEEIVVEEVKHENNTEASIEEKLSKVDEELSERKKGYLDQALYEQAKEAIENKIESEENYSEFIEEIATDVLGCVKKLRTVEIQDGKITEIIPGEENKEYEFSGVSPRQIELVNGLYLNRQDVEKAVRNYKRQNKGRTFIVKGNDSTLNVTKKSVNKVKEVLRKFSLRDLLREKKISDFDVRRVYGKEKAEEYTYYDNNEESLTENYVRLNDVYDAFKKLFVEKTPTWLEKLTSKFLGDKVEEIEEVQDADYVQLEDEMTWNAEEPEYEVVRAKTK